MRKANPIIGIVFIAIRQQREERHGVGSLSSNQHRLRGGSIIKTATKLQGLS
jgi:hypothetical protein